jgi:manganese/zinc/iron transport system ATP- binding protein
VKPIVLDVRDLTVHYMSSPVLWDIHCSIPAGHLVSIMGPNGAGKTTFIKAVLGLLIGTTGVVKLLNHSIDKVRKRIAYVPQRGDVDWDFPITVRELVEMGCYPKRGLFRSLRQEDRKSVDDALDRLGLQDLAKKQIGRLSGGQQQRAFLARAIAQDADLYFLDEPFSGVDHISEQIIIDLLKSMRHTGKTIFIVHHDLVSAAKYFDYLILLNTRLIASGPFKKVFTTENLRMAYGQGITLIEEVLKMSQDVLQGFSNGSV